MTMHKQGRIVFAPVCLIGIIHIICGLGVLIEPTAIHVSGLAGLYIFNLHKPYGGFTLIIVGVLAIVGRIIYQRHSFYLVMPQQIILVAQFVGIVVSIYNGAYPDGFVPVPNNILANISFMLVDQSPLLGLCIAHTLDMVLAPRINDLADFYKEQLTFSNEKLAHSQRLIEYYRENEFWNGFGKDIEKSMKN